jgi:hypothetical protein
VNKLWIDPVFVRRGFPGSQKMQACYLVSATYVRREKAATLTSKEWNKSALFCNLS